MSKSVVFLLGGLVAIIAAVIMVAGYFWGDELLEPVDLPPAREVTNSGSEENINEVEAEVEVIATDLEIPWEIVFLPDGDLLVTQRTGSVVRIGEDRQVYNIEGVEHRGEGGLLGMALHPDFASNQFIYLYMTTETGDGLENRVVRYQLENDALSNPETILDGIPGAIYHDGGRIAFSPDGYLYITTGDAREPELSQDRQSLAGKILRINDDGSIPEDNPFENEVYSTGHRNPQGLAWDGEGNLWSTEHGATARDELNLIERGSNYGWPNIQGDQTRDGMKTPAVHSGTDTWAPASAAYWQGSIFFGGLRGTSLYKARLDGIQVTSVEEYFAGEFGRIRAVVVGPDDYIYITTSNTDGRGRTQDGDDKIIRINPDIFNQ